MIAKQWAKEQPALKPLPKPKFRAVTKSRNREVEKIAKKHFEFRILPHWSLM
jgi:hypothetical protein